jgi:hypothetical protein
MLKHEDGVSLRGPQDHEEGRRFASDFALAAIRVLAVKAYTAR